MLNRDQISEEISKITENSTNFHKIRENFYFPKQTNPDSPKSTKRKLKLRNGCSSSGLKKWLLLRFPIFDLILHYKLKEDLIRDIVAGVNVALIHIPQGMGYATLAYLHPISGIYMAIFPTFFYTIFSTSRHCSMGSFAIVCLVAGKAVLLLATFQDPGADGALVGNLSNGTATFTPAEVSTILCFEIAAWMFIFGFLNLGILNVFLSDVVIAGFTTGAAVQVVTTQLRSLFGISIIKPAGIFHVILTWKAIFENLSDYNPTTLLISMICLLLLFSNESIKPYIAKVTKVPIPIELIVLVLGTLISKYGTSNCIRGIQVIGEYPVGFPHPQLPPFELLGRIIMPSLMISIVSFRMAFGMTKSLAKKNDYPVDPAQEFYAMAIGNAVGSFFQSAPISASLSRSLVQESAGAKTQLSSIISCCVLAVCLFAMGSFFEELPNCVLASITVASLKGLFLQVFGFIKLWKLSKVEASVYLITLLGVVIIDIDIGLFIGVTVSLLMLIYKSQAPTMTVLGKVPNTDIYLDNDKYSSVNEIPRLKILHIVGVLHFANTECFRQMLIKTSGIDPKLVNSTNAVHQSKIAKEPLSQFAHDTISDQVSETERTKTGTEGAEKLSENRINFNTNPDPVICNSVEDDLACKAPHMFTEVQHIIIDMSGIVRLDISAAQNLACVYEEYAAAKISLCFSATSDSCMEVMERSGALETVPFKAFFHSIHEGVRCISYPEMQDVQQSCPQSSE